MKTQEAIEQMTLQEAVDYAVQQIVQQGGRCTDHSGCAYGNGSGQHCAVGWLLDHTNEKLMMTGGGVRSLLNNSDFDGLLPSILSKHKPAFVHLQMFHDAKETSLRESRIAMLQGCGIDTSGEWFQQWIDMGEE